LKIKDNKRTYIFFTKYKNPGTEKSGDEKSGDSIPIKKSGDKKSGDSIPIK